MRSRIVPITALVAVAIVAIFVIVIWLDQPRSDEPGAASEPLPPPPTVNVEGELTHDFGIVELDGGRELAHTFTIGNAEDHAIELSVEGTSCNCLAGALSKRTLEPGESVEIDVILEVRKPGPTEQKAYINANGALVILHVSADVIQTAQPAEEPGASAP